MIESKKFEIIILECHPFMWWFIVTAHLSAIFIIVAGPLAAVANGIFVPKIIFIMSICFAIVYFCSLISLPRRIVIDESSVSVIWPWRTCCIPVGQITNIRVKEFRIKSVFITIVRKNVLFNTPLIFTWAFQSEDYEKVLGDVVKRFGGIIKMRGHTTKEEGTRTR